MVCEPAKHAAAQIGDAVDAPLPFAEDMRWECASVLLVLDRIVPPRVRLIAALLAGPAIREMEIAIPRAPAGLPGDRV